MIFRLLLALVLICGTARATTGEVQLIGTPTSSSNFSGFPLTNSYDGDFTTTWASNTDASGWIGNDAGVNVVATRFRFAPRGDFNFAPIYELRPQGSNLQQSTSSSYTTGVTTLDTIPTFPFYPRYQFNERTLTGGSAARYLRSINTAANTYGGNYAEVRWIIQAGTAATARPVAPVISPWGGFYPVGSTTVTFTSLTTSASFYYTTDGSTPTTGSTLYTSPFTLTAGTSTVLKVIAYDAGCSTTTSEVSTSTFQNYGYAPAANVYDSNGNLINAYGGNITQVGTTFYLVGAPVNQANETIDTVGNRGVWEYTSTDMLNWTPVGNGNVLDNTSANWKWIERPKILVIDSTHYVLWAHGTNSHDSSDRACVATASAPGGPWTWVTTSLDPDGLGFRDFNVFQDDTGTNYLVYSTITGTYVSQLNANGLTTTGSYVQAISSATREAPILFKNGSVYFLITSTNIYYDSTLNYDITCVVNSGASPIAAWPAYGTAAALFTSSPTATTYNAQPAYVIKPAGQGTYAYGSDRWNASALYDTRQVTIPLTFPSSTTVNTQTPATWNLTLPTLSTPGLPGSRSGLLLGFPW